MSDDHAETYRALFESTIAGDLSAVKRGIEAGFAPNTPDAYGFLLLHRACVNDQPEIVSFLLECGSEINWTAHNDWTPLHCAAIAGSLDCAKVLLDNAAKVNAKDDRGNTPLHLTTIGDHRVLLNLLIRHGGDLNLLNHKNETVGDKLFGDFKQTFRRD